MTSRLGAGGLWLLLLVVVGDDAVSARALLPLLLQLGPGVFCCLYLALFPACQKMSRRTLLDARCCGCLQRRLSTSFTLCCRGNNAVGQLGCGSIGNTHAATPCRVASGERWLRVVAGATTACGISAANEGSLWCCEFGTLMVAYWLGQPAVSCTGRAAVLLCTLLLPFQGRLPPQAANRAYWRLVCLQGET